MSSMPFIMMRHAAQSYWVDAEHNFDAAQKNDARKLCSDLLGGAAFDRTAISRMAARGMYAVAVRTLLDEAGNARLLELLYSPVAKSVIAFQCACFFGVCSRKNEVARFTIEDLRSVDSENAAMALAACGEEIDWPKASTKVRAVYTLRALVEARRS